MIFEPDVPVWATPTEIRSPAETEQRVVHVESVPDVTELSTVTERSVSVRGAMAKLMFA